MGGSLVNKEVDLLAKKCLINMDAHISLLFLP